MLKALAMYLNERKAAYYELSYATGATKIDSWIDETEPSWILEGIVDFM